MIVYLRMAFYPIYKHMIFIYIIQIRYKRIIKCTTIAQRLKKTYGVSLPRKAHATVQDQGTYSGSLKIKSLSWNLDDKGYSQRFETIYMALSALKNLVKISELMLIQAEASLVRI